MSTLLHSSAAIASEDISVVIQGPVVPVWTAEAVAGVRRCLPGAELILSTWKGTPQEDLAALPVDAVLLNDDPGGHPLCGNLNRQIVSSRNGLRLARRPYAVKTRADMGMTHTGFLDLFRAFPARLDDHRYFTERLVIVNAWHPGVVGRLCPSDFFYFGLREDVTALWEVPLFPSMADMALLPEAYRQDLRFFMLEQYPFLMHARRIRHLSPQCDPAENARHYEESLRILMNNFVCAGVDHVGVRFLKDTLVHLNETETNTYSKYWFSSWLFGEWCETYERQCAASIRPPTEALAAAVAEGRSMAAHKATLFTPGPPNTHNDFPICWDPLMAAGRTAAREGRHRAALNVFSLMSLSRPHEPAPMEELASLCRAMGDPETARLWDTQAAALSAKAG